MLFSHIVLGSKWTNYLGSNAIKKRWQLWNVGRREDWVHEFPLLFMFVSWRKLFVSNLEPKENKTYPRRRPNHRRDVWLQRGCNRDFCQKAGSCKSVSLTQKTPWIRGRCFGHERGSYAKPVGLKYTTHPTTQTTELAIMSHFIASAKFYPDDSFPESRNVPIPFRHFEVKIDVVRVMHVEEIA